MLSHPFPSLSPARHGLHCPFTQVNCQACSRPAKTLKVRWLNLHPSGWKCILALCTLQLIDGQSVNNQLTGQPNVAQRNQICYLLSHWWIEGTWAGRIDHAGKPTVYSERQGNDGIIIVSVKLISFSRFPKLCPPCCANLQYWPWYLWHWQAKTNT